MCQFTVYLDGHDDSNIVAESVVKTTIKDGYIALMDANGRVTKVPNAVVKKVDTIMTELILETAARSPLLRHFRVQYL
ncbi:MAG: CooT family nickel-binding protein [Candidatus Methanomethylophilaceae archaeon]|nr:CooT family nickel-binding protein [Candidatus Methanomethylophilaceae archaeon]